MLDGLILRVRTRILDADDAEVSAVMETCKLSQRAHKALQLNPLPIEPVVARNFSIRMELEGLWEHELTAEAVLRKVRGTELGDGMTLAVVDRYPCPGRDIFTEVVARLRAVVGKGDTRGEFNHHEWCAPESDVRLEACHEVFEKN